MSTTRTCPSCGEPAGEGERFCANCGARLPDEPAAPPPGPQTVLLPQQGDEPPQAPPTVLLPQQGDEPEPPAAPTIMLSPQQPAPQPPGAGRGETPGGGLRLPGDAPSPPAGLPQGAPPARRKGLPIWAVLLLGLAGLCAVGCVAGFLILAYIGRQATDLAATAVLEIDATIQALPTLPALDELATPETQPTEEEAGAEPSSEVILALPTDGPTPVGAGGVVGGGAAGAASQVQTSQAATAVVGGTAAAEELFNSATVVFQDEFVDNRNAWFVGVFQEIETNTIEDGVFKVIWAGAGTSYELYEVRELTNFIAEVDCLVVQGGGDGSCGLVFGQQEDGSFYKYELFEDYFRLYIVPGEGEPTLLAEGSPEGAVLPGQTNRLRVVRQGDDITIFVNGAPLAATSDLTFLTGKVGVSTNSYNEAGGVEVWFDNFIIWELPG